jgi:Flp pilus assembly secretin CpaC
MWHFFQPTLRHAAMAAFAGTLSVTAGGAVAQTADQVTLRLAGPTPEPTVVKRMSDVGESLQVTVGHSRLLIGETPFGTIIVGDDTIAGASLGPGHSIILTGLTAGSTNLIILDEGLEPVLTTRIAVVPVEGALRSTVTVTKGIEVREVYECRKSSCQRMAENEQQREFPYVPVANRDSDDTADPSME